MHVNCHNDCSELELISHIDQSCYSKKLLGFEAEVVAGRTTKAVAYTDSVVRTGFALLAERITG
jgi:hypothetical protein